MMRDITTLRKQLSTEVELLWEAEGDGWDGAEVAAQKALALLEVVEDVLLMTERNVQIVLATGGSQ